ncbi:unnamed protein product [Psylliodes chrysocephalus]|uniref:Myb/SANT-like DNA-binding domain-containing protein n=1 Tax=Psylliodes chrysocephalus TaxID=3402493 RepID=A0A9P0D6Q3_9CUCU|nr:unnamed protein product [Psylliodes chrysocephala]
MVFTYKRKTHRQNWSTESMQQAVNVNAVKQFFNLHVVNTEKCTNSSRFVVLLFDYTKEKVPEPQPGPSIKRNMPEPQPGSSKESDTSLEFVRPQAILSVTKVNQYKKRFEKDQIKETEEDTNSIELRLLKWTDDAIRFLIQTYKEHLEEFLSTKERNVKVWSRVLKELIANGFNYTQNQCMFKFKYLKSKYMLKKDNMKGGANG